MKAYKVSYDNFTELDDRYLLLKDKAFESINYAIDKRCNEIISKYNNEYDFCTNEEFKKLYEEFIEDSIFDHVIKLENNTIWYNSEYDNENEIRAIYFYININEDDGSRCPSSMFFSVEEIEVE